MSALPTETVQHILSMLPFDNIAELSGGSLPITEEDRPYNKILQEKHKIIYPVPFAKAYLMLHEGTVHNILIYSINSGIHEHFIATLRYYNIIPEDLWSVEQFAEEMMPCYQASARTIKVLNAGLDAHAKRNSLTTQFTCIPEVLRHIIEILKRQGRLSTYKPGGTTILPARAVSVLPILAEHNIIPDMSFIGTYPAEMFLTYPGIANNRMFPNSTRCPGYIRDPLHERLEDIRILAEKDPQFASNYIYACVVTHEIERLVAYLLLGLTDDVSLLMKLSPQDKATFATLINRSELTDDKKEAYLM